MPDDWQSSDSFLEMQDDWQLASGEFKDHGTGNGCALLYGNQLLI